jgi:hypothetical protein
MLVLSMIGVLFPIKLNTQVSLQVLDMINDPHYLYRMTILHAISLLAPVLGSEITSTNLLPLVVNAAKDR